MHVCQLTSAQSNSQLRSSTKHQDLGAGESASAYLSASAHPGRYSHLCCTEPPPLGQKCTPTMQSVMHVFGISCGKQVPFLERRVSSRAPPTLVPPTGSLAFWKVSRCNSDSRHPAKMYHSSSRHLHRARGQRWNLSCISHLDGTMSRLHTGHCIYRGTSTPA